MKKIRPKGPKLCSAKGFQRTQSGSEEFLSDWVQTENNEEKNLVKDGSTTSSVNLGSDIDDDNDEAGSVLGENDDEITSEDAPSGNVKKQRRQLKRYIKMNSDIVKFISKRNKYSQELSEKLEMLSAEIQLIPEKSLITVTKKLRSRYIKNWNKRCCSIVKTFCSRFRKDCFELKESISVRKALPKLGNMLRSSSAAYWIEDNRILAVMTEQSEREHVLEKVGEFLQSLGNDGFQECKRKSRSDQSDRRKPQEYDAARNINVFNSLNEDADDTEVPGKEKPSKQLQKSVKIDNDIAKFLMKRKKYSEELKDLLSRLGAEFQLKPGFIKIKKVDVNIVANWEKRCEDTVDVFCSCFQKQYFPVGDEIRDSILEALTTLQKDVSSTGAACWLDTHKQNLILVSLKVELSNAAKEVEEFIQKVGIFARKSFQIEESIHELVEKDLPTLKEALKSCNITLNKQTLVVVCLRNEADNIVGKVESFLQRLQRIKLADANSMSSHTPHVPVHSKSSVDESDTSHPTQYGAESLASPHQEKRIPPRGKPVKLKPLSVKINNDVGKFVKNNTTFSHELADQLKQLNAEIQWKTGFGLVTIIQKSADVPVPKWSERCKGLVTQFFQRFRKESYTIQTDIQDSVFNRLEGIKESISSSGADCWLASKNRELVLVALKDNLSSVVKVVEGFLRNLREEHEKPKEIVKFVEVSSDHVDYLEHTQFLDTLKQSHPGIVEATITEARNEICFVGSDEAISAAKQQYADLGKELNVIELQLPTEVMKFVSQKAGQEFIDKCLSDRGTVYVILVGSKFSVKVVARSSQEFDEVKDCLCKNVREATITLPSKSEHIFASKKWYQISKTIESEKLVDYQINFVKETRRDIKLHGATHLVEKYDKIVRDFINSQKIEYYEVNLTPGIARFMKEKLCKEIEKIESDLRDEQVKIEVHQGSGECKGTKEGIHESKKRIVALSGEITSRSKDYSSVGVGTLFVSEHGQRNIKGIEAGCNAVIEVGKRLTTTQKESTQGMVEAIRAERAQGKSKMKQVSPSAPTDLFDQCNFTTKEGLKVSWKYGNIAQERADILVSSAVPNLNNPTTVGRVLNSVGGPSFMTACSQHTNVGTGDIRTTIGGNLLCNYVIHAVCCDWNSRGGAEQTLRSLFLKILLECARYSAKSVAMPLIGTGKHRFPEDFVLRVMREEFEKFSSMYLPGTLKEIKLVRYDQGMRRTTVPAQPVSGSTNHMATPSYKSSHTFVPLVAGISVDCVKLHVYARSSQDISLAFDEIEKFIQNHITSKKIKHEKLFDVVLKHWDELKRLAKDNGLRITCVDATTVSIEGMLSKVVEAKDKLTELVSRYTDEERMSNQLSYISQNVQWYYYDLSSREVAYSAQMNGTIEVAGMNGEAVVEIIEPDGQQYVVHFTQMVARNTRSGQTKKLTRKLIGLATSLGSELSLPSNWTPQPENQVVQLVRIATSSQEYLEVFNHFVARGGNASQLYKVERIQNPQLYSRYLAFKKSMRDQGNEIRLFHGTDAANIDSINAHNFSRSFAGVNGVAYGNGVYFARDASYSMGYANRQLLGSRPKMYMAKVLVGDYTRGAKGMKAPPLKNDPINPGLRYDSVVDHPSNPSMYIIFQDNQYYPEYLLTMR